MPDTPKKKKKVTIVAKKKQGGAKASASAAPPAAGTKKKADDKGGLLDLSRLLDFPAGLAEGARDVWMAGIGALSSVEEAGQAVFDELVRKGETWERESRQKLLSAGATAAGAAEGAKATAQDLARAPVRLAAGAEAQIQRMVEDSVEGVLHRIGVPTHEEVQDLIRRVDALTRKVEAATERTASKPAPKKPEPAQATPKPKTASKATVYHVAPGEGGWTVQREGAARATSVHPTKAEAVAAGRDRAKGQTPSRLVVHKQDGTIQDHFSYEA